MEEEEDDLYGQGTVSNDATDTTTGDTRQEMMFKEDPTVEVKPAVDNDEENDDDDSDDSSIDIVVEAKEGTDAPPPQKFAFQRAKGDPVRISTDVGSAVKRERDSAQPRPESAGPVKKIAVKDGSKMPEVRTSDMDLDQDPIYGATGKPITEIDLDADIAMETKPWRVAGTNPTDFFNYGFDEFTWVQYCLKQKTMRESVNGLRQESKQFEAMLGGQPQPSMPQPQGMPGMPDMPPEMMNAMFAQMQAQGISDPSQLDFNSIMQNMGMMGMMPGMQGMPGQQQQQQQQQGYGQFGGQGMQQQASGQGYGQHGGSTPQANPQGYGQIEDFSGFSEQQMNMYKQQQQQQGGFANRRGRGRGRY